MDIVTGSNMAVPPEDHLICLRISKGIPIETKVADRSTQRTEFQILRAGVR